MIKLRKPAKALATTGALVAAIALPVAFAAPAEAATTSGGCTVTPLAPIFDGFSSSGTKLVRFRVRITCSDDRTVYVQQQRWEEDSAPDTDDGLGTVNYTRVFDGGRSTITVSSVRTLPNTESGNEEIYQRVRFHVSSNGVTSGWTSFERTAAVSMPN